MFFKRPLLAMERRDYRGTRLKVGRPVRKLLQYFRRKMLMALIRALAIKAVKRDWIMDNFLS